MSKRKNKIENVEVLFEEGSIDVSEETSEEVMDSKVEEVVEEKFFIESVEELEKTIGETEAIIRFHDTDMDDDFSIDSFSEDIEEKTEVEEIIESPKLKTPIYSKGVIINCAKLRIRSNPNLKSQVIGHFSKDDVIKIFNEESTKTFHCVVTGKTKGFCLKTFIDLI